MLTTCLPLCFPPPPLTLHLNDYVHTAARSGSSLHVARDVEGEMEGLVEQLREGTPEERGLAAEKLFNKAAEDETARRKAAAVGVIQPLVSSPAPALMTAWQRKICFVVTNSPVDSTLFIADSAACITPDDLP